MATMKWTGVMPAITTPFTENDTVDLEFLKSHAQWMIDAGCTGMIGLGSLGEGATLSFEEKCGILETLVESVGSRVPVTASVSALSTKEAVRLAKTAKEIGCRGLMVLPPYVHKGEWREIKAHLDGIIQATDLSCMIYNNPIAYGTDFSPAQLAGLASEYNNVHAVKESGGDVRRITAVKALTGDSLAVFAGLDDMAFEAGSIGADGWVAGLVNAFPVESVRVFELAQQGKRDEAFALYRWFLPLLRLDTVPEFVQLIKLVQQEVGRGSERVRLPRLPAGGVMRENALQVIGEAVKNRPQI